MKGCFLDVTRLPKPAKTFFALVYFVEASLLLYGLATKFPMEYNVLFGAALLVYALAQRTLTWPTPPKREAIEKQRLGLLEQALERLKDMTGLGEELKVVWQPGRSKLAGEVIGSTIHIYVEEPDDALNTLTHEFIEYIMTRPQKRLLRLINALLLQTTNQVYRETDKAAEAISQLLIDKIRNKTE